MSGPRPSRAPADPPPACSPGSPSAALVLTSGGVSPGLALPRAGPGPLPPPGALLALSPPAYSPRVFAPVPLPLPRVQAARVWPCSDVPPGGLVLELALPWRGSGVPGVSPFSGPSLHLLWDPRVRGRRGSWRLLARHVCGVKGGARPDAREAFFLLLPSGRGSLLPALLCSPRVLPLVGGPREGARSAGSALSSLLGDVPSFLLALDVMGS